MIFLQALSLSLFLCSVCLSATDGSGEPAVLSGLDHLAQERFATLQGLRVGVITNQTGRNKQGVSIIELLSRAEGVKLRAVFAPEHGLEGVLEREYSSSHLGPDSLPVFSLYGKVRKPEREWLEGLDVLVFDIQDIGTRFYTYISTLALCMQAATEAGLRFVVLDRPDPLGGLVVEGPVLEKELQGNFIAFYPIPVRHGMTVGELARLFNAEFGIGAKLEVVPMTGWRRRMYYDDTGLAWVNPSPNMCSLAAAIFYPGLGIAEATSLSVGRGTDLPFELYGAPWVDGKCLAREMNAVGLAGIEFRDTVFVPRKDRFAGQNCGGVRAVLTDRNAFRSLEAGMQLLSLLERLYPDKLDLSRLDLWVGRRDVKTFLAKGVPPSAIVAGWREGLQEFMKTREKYLLYPP